MNAKDIFPGVHYIDNTFYYMYSYAKETCPKAEYVSEHVISLPLHMKLIYEDVQYICDNVIEFTI